MRSTATGSGCRLGSAAARWRSWPRSGRDGGGCLLHRVNDAVVDAAAAEMRIERRDDVGTARLAVLFKQRRGRDQNAGETIAALPGLLVEERLLQGVQRAAVGQPLDRGDGPARDGRG